VASFSNGNITYGEVLENLNVLDYEYYFNITESFLKGDSGKALLLFDEILQRGFDGQNFIGGLSSHFRDLLVCHDPATMQLLEVSEALKARYRQQAGVCPAEFLFAALEICNQCEISYKSTRNQRLHVELALIRLCGIAGEKKNLIREHVSLTVPSISKTGEPGKEVKNATEKEVKTVTGHITRQSDKSAPFKEPEPQYEPLPKISIRDTLRAAENVQPDDKKATVAPKGDDTVPVQDQAAAKPLSEEFMMKCWNSYASQIREEKPRMAVTLKNVKPVISEGNTILIEMNNRDQLEDFNKSTKDDLEKFLRREMQQALIAVEARLI
jgi:DNA polymerase-3 subunit gamma/tau